MALPARVRVPFSRTGAADATTGDNVVGRNKVSKSGSLMPSLRSGLHRRHADCSLASFARSCPHSVRACTDAMPIARSQASLAHALTPFGPAQTPCRLLARKLRSLMDVRLLATEPPHRLNRSVRGARRGSYRRRGTIQGRRADLRANL